MLLLDFVSISIVILVTYYILSKTVKSEDMGKLKNRIPELLQLKGIRDRKRYLQKDLAEGSGLADSAISRLMALPESRFTGL